jgi:hypothetical protein
LELIPYGRVAFTSGSLETVKVNNLDITTAVSNKFFSLQRMGNHRYAVTTSTNHLRHQFLR